MVLPSGGTTRWGPGGIGLVPPDGWSSIDTAQEALGRAVNAAPTKNRGHHRGTERNVFQRKKPLSGARRERLSRREKTYQRKTYPPYCPGPRSTGPCRKENRKRKKWLDIATKKEKMVKSVFCDQIGAMDPGRENGVPASTRGEVNP